MKLVMVGVDGSKVAESALVWAARLARSAGAELLVATAVAPSGSAPASRPSEERMAEAARMLEDWALPAAIEGVECQTVVLEGKPGALLTAADTEDADLIVVGTRGTGYGVHLGSVAHHLAHHTTRPLAVVPGSADLPLDAAVLGMDASEGAAEAARWCADALGPLGMTVYAVHAFAPVLEWIPEHDHGLWHHQAAKQLRQWTAPLDEAGLEVVPVVAPDIHPERLLTRVAEEHRAGMIVVGSRGLGRFPGRRLGRLPLHLVQRTALPTILVPPRTS